MTLTLYPGKSRPQVASSTSGLKKIVHRVRRGESLYKIARRYGTSVGSIRKWNNLRNASLIYPGQRIKIYKR